MNITDLLRGGVLLLSVTLASTVSASVGKVIVSVGLVEGVTPQGEVRVLKRRSEVFKTDTVKTYAGAKTQMRFSDGSMLALGENSLFKVEEYEFGSGNPEKAVYHLLKGSMQTITGAIGKTNKKDYSLKTPVATIGIRGTYYQLQLTPSGGLIGGVKDGAIVVENRAGEAQRIAAGEFFQMASPDAEIDVLDEPPAGLEVVDQAGAAPDGEADQRQGSSLQEQGVEINSSYEEPLGSFGDDSEPLGVDTDPGSLDENAGGSSSAAEGQDAGGLPGDANATGGRLDLTPTGALAPNGNGLLLAFVQVDPVKSREASSDGFVTDADHQLYLTNVAGVADTPTYLEIKDTASGECNVCQFSSGSAAHVESAGDTTFDVNWGRWNGAFVLAENGQELSVVGPDFHYMHSDNLTPYDQLAALSGTISFGSLGGTTPTDSQGNTGTLMNMNMDVNFTSMQFTYVNMQVNAGSTSYSGTLVNPTDISRSLTTELILDNGRIEAQFVGQNPVSGPDLGIITSYELKDAASGNSVVGTNLLGGS